MALPSDAQGIHRPVRFLTRRHHPSGWPGAAVTNLDFMRVMDVMEPENESHLVHVDSPSTPKTETDADIAPLIQNVGATSIAEIEKLMSDLQEVKNFLQYEGERIQRETARYMNLTQMASASVKIIFDTVSGWREAGHPMREFEMHSPAKRTAPVAWSAPSIKSRNADFLLRAGLEGSESFNSQIRVGAPSLPKSSKAYEV
jgi:hypothetical protein